MRRCFVAKRGFLDGYKTYDPETEGYGSPNQWRSAFHKRMSAEEAREVLNEHKWMGSPREILGVGIKATPKEIRSAYRRLSMACHPDRCILNHMTKEEAEEKFKVITAAYTELCPDGVI